MKIIFLFTVLEIISFNSNSQRRINDTLPDNTTTHKLTPFAVQINPGVASYLFDRKTEKYLGNYWGPSVRLSFYYKHFIGGLGIRPTTLNTKDTLFFDQHTLYTHQDFHLINGIFFLGYKFELAHHFSLDPYVGSLTTTFALAYQTQRHAKSSNGYTCGISINKYFEKLSGQYLVVFLNANINKSNYDQIHADLGTSFYAIEFGLAYNAGLQKK